MMRRPTNKWIRRSIVAFICLGILYGVFCILATREMARAFVAAPNREHPGRLPKSPLASTMTAVQPTASLAVSVLEPSGTPRGTIFLLHGHADYKENMVSLAQPLVDAGYLVVLPDSRGHGGSTGDLITFGLLESRDMQQLVGQIAHLKKPLIAIGFSYGGSTALQWAAIDSRVERVVAMSTFTSMREVIPNIARKSMAGWQRFLFGWRIPAAVEVAGKRASVDPDAASPLRAIRQLQIPVLLIHGTDDDWIPISHHQQLLSAAPSGTIAFQIPNAGHMNMIYRPHSDAAAKRILDWLRSLDAQPTTRESGAP